MNLAIYIEEEKIDLFYDETIEINSSVQNVNDITKNTLDFSKNFTVPASNINNKIFKHWYNSNIDNGFDARRKVNGRIEINGVTFKYGKFSLLSVKLKQGKPSSYSLVFYGNAISLADKLGNDELSSLDLSAYDHEYNSTNVEDGLLFGLFSGEIKYTLMAKKRYYYNSSVTDDSVQSETTSNIANVAWANGILWSDLRASIKLLPIIEAVETKYDLTFSRDFLNRAEFTNINLWLDNEAQKEISTEIEVNFDNTGDVLTTPYPDFTGYVSIDLANNSYIFLNQFYPTSILIFPYIIIQPSAGYEAVPYQVLELENGEQVVIREAPVGGYQEFQTGNSTTKNTSFKVKTNIEFKFTARLRFKITAVSQFNKYTNYFAEQTINVNYTISNQLPKIKTIDFLKGLFQMFKLVIVQEKETDPIYVNTLKDYYSEAVLYDITEYVGTNEQTVERGKLLNEIIYKYQDPTTLLNKQFKENTGLGYGDNELILKEDMEDPDSNKLEGEKEEIVLPFEQVVYERLTNQDDLSQTNVIVGGIYDDKISGVNIKPHLHYIFYHNTSPNSIKFVRDNSTTIGLVGFMNTMAHTNDFTGNPPYSLVFDREYSNYTGVAIENTLYTNYHEDYITSVFNVKKRLYKIEAKLPLRIVLKLKLKDVIKIYDNYYRINTWTYNLMTGKCKLELINSFDNTINGFNASRTTINTDGTAKIESIFVTNFTNLIFDYTATWINSATFLGNNVYFGIDANDTGLFRTEVITLINSDTLAEIEITINQTPNIINFGNEVILWGSTEITFEL